MKLKDIKKAWQQSYGEGTQFDLDYGKLAILICASILQYRLVNETKVLRSIL